MSDYSVDVGATARGTFVVYDGLGNPIAGLTRADFSILLENDGFDYSSTAVVIEEISSGRYHYSFVPAAGGNWYLLIRSGSYNAQGWDEDFEVRVTARGGGGAVKRSYLTREILDRAKRLEQANEAALMTAVMEACDDDF